MKIYIIERNIEKFNYLKPYFDGLEDVILVNNDFDKFMNNNDIECIVSPANSFGIMNGGYDLAITKYFGKELQKKVQQYIIDNYYAEQPVGSSFIIKINDIPQYLIHTPTMRTPSKIKDETLIYQCMRTTLMEAYKNDIKSILIPMFGGSAGGVHPQVIARMMRLAYDQVKEKPNNILIKNIMKLRDEKTF